jgi:hypothetical protein
MFGNSKDSTKKRIVDLNNNPIKLTPPALDLNSESWTLKTRKLSEYEPIKPCPSPEKIESESSTKQTHYSKYINKTR